jgi:hypothetical protein
MQGGVGLRTKSAAAANQEISDMSGSVDVPVGTRSSTTFLRVLAFLSLALAAAEFILVVHYHHQEVAAETVT